MSATWTLVAVLFVGTALLKASGPLALGERRPPDRALAVIRLVAPALLTALIAYQTFSGSPSGIALDERVIGLAVAAVALALRAPMIVVVATAAAATALARLVA